MLNNKNLVSFLIIICLIFIGGCSKKEEPKTDDVKKLEHTQSEKQNDRVTSLDNQKKVKNNVYLDNIDMSGLTESQVNDKLAEIASKIDTQVKNAVLDRDSWTITDNGQTGKKVDVEFIKQSIFQAAEGSRIPLKINEQKPEITPDKIKANIVMLGESTTKLLDKKPERLKNIAIALKSIDGYKLEPGQPFSFNEVVGKRTVEKGYGEAPAIISTPEGPKKIQAVGGGVCQISTTLYNAVKAAGLEILERHEHAYDIFYVPKGEDATVSYGELDFRFRNSKNKQIMITVSMDNESLNAKVFENRNQ